MISSFAPQIMMFSTGLLALSFLVASVSAAHHGGLTLLCRACHSVKDPRECNSMERCHENCATEVHNLDNNIYFTYSCKPKDDCQASVNLIGKRGRHDHGLLLCRECCNSTGCDSHTCSRYFDRTTTPKPYQPTTTMATTTPDDNGCRDYESPSFQCAELEKYNFCTDTSSVAYAIAHEKCAKHCGFCSPFGSVAPVTEAPVTVAPVTEPVATTTMGTDFSTTKIFAETPIVVQVNVTSGVTDDCVDQDDPTLPCVDMQKFGFCSPDSGAGYTFAQLRCRKTCAFC